MGKIKKSIQLFLLRRAMKRLSYRHRVVGYHHATRVALLYNATPDGKSAFINKLTKDLENDGKSVFTLGFFNQKRIPEEIMVVEKGDFVARKSFSIWMQPTSDVVRKFVEQSYDLLIDLTVQGPYMAKYIAGITKASYKTGVHHPDYLSVYDLLLHVNDQITDEQLADHVIHYLKIIKTPEEK